MTYALASALQQAVYARLLETDTLQKYVGDDVFDALPSGVLPETYVSLGPETAEDASDITNAGAEHEFIISVVTSADSFQLVKDIAAIICDALVGAALSLPRGHLVGLWFVKAKAWRTENQTTRRIDLQFRARVQETQNT